MVTLVGYNLSLNHILRVRLTAVNAGYREDEAAIHARLADLDRQWIAAKLPQDVDLLLV